MRIALFGIPCKEDLKGWSSGSLGNFSLVRAKCREGSDDAVVFFKQNVRRALRGAKDKNSRREGGDGEIFISAGTVPRARRSIVVWMMADRDAFWQWRPCSSMLFHRLRNHYSRINSRFSRLFARIT